MDSAISQEFQENATSVTAVAADPGFEKSRLAAIEKLGIKTGECGALITVFNDKSGASGTLIQDFKVDGGGKVIPNPSSRPAFTLPQEMPGNAFLNQKIFSNSANAEGTLAGGGYAKTYAGTKFSCDGPKR